jgi:hypothetical protein
MSHIPAVDAFEEVVNAAERQRPHRTNEVSSKRTAKRKDDSLLEIVCRWIVDHQIGISHALLQCNL